MSATGGAEPWVGRTIGGYEVLAKLGQGGMATVHLAVSRRAAGFTKLVVIKVLRPELADDPEFRAMFVDEARLAARINHPNVVHTYEVGEDGADLFIVMEYLDGVPLSALLRKVGRENVPLPIVLRILVDVLAGLGCAHSLTAFDGTPTPLVHRDISPQNIFLERGGHVKVLDFGIAKVAGDETSTKAGMVKGKVGYMAPEQIANRAIDARTDLFSVGVVLWEALTGRRLVAVGDNELAAMQQRLRGDPDVRTLAPDAPAVAAAICARAMSLDPRDRYASAAELRAVLLHELDAHGNEGSNAAVGSLVTAHFDEQHARLQRTIAERLAAPVVADGGVSEVREVREVREGGSGPHAVTQPPAPPMVSRRPRRPLLAWAAATGLLAFGLAAGGRHFVASRASTATAPPSALAIATLPADIPATGTVPSAAGCVVIVVSPPRAEVVVDGVVLAPPHRILTRRGARYHVVASAGGYAPSSQWVEGGAPGACRDLAIVLAAQRAQLARSSTGPAPTAEAALPHNTNDSRHKIDDQDPYDP